MEDSILYALHALSEDDAREVGSVIIHLNGDKGSMVITPCYFTLGDIDMISDDAKWMIAVAAITRRRF